MNRNRDTYEYHKGNWEPIISEEQWERVQMLKKSKHRITTVHDGNVCARSLKNSSSIWVNKLRCSCGSCFRKNRFHKAKDGTLSYNFVCYNQVRYGKASERAKVGADTEGYCNESSITEWKMEMMSDAFIDQVWNAKKDDLLSLVDEITEYYKEDSKKSAETSIGFIEGQIDNLEKKTKNLLDIFADGQITKEEFSEMRKSYDEQINAFNEQKKLISERNEQYSRCFDSLSCISKALGDMIDISNDMVRSKLLDKFLVSVVPDNGRYNWNYKLSEYDQA